MVFESEFFSDDTNWLSVPEPSSQTELIDLLCDLGLFKKAAEILAFRLQKKHLLDDERFVFSKARPLFCNIFCRPEAVCLLSQYLWFSQALRCCLAHTN